MRSLTALLFLFIIYETAIPNMVSYKSFPEAEADHLFSSKILRKKSIFHVIKRL